MTTLIAVYGPVLLAAFIGGVSLIMRRLGKLERKAAILADRQDRLRRDVDQTLTRKLGTIADRQARIRRDLDRLSHR